MTSAESVGSVTDRLNWLFDVVTVLDPANGRRPYTDAEVGEGVGVSQIKIALHRRGEPATPDLLSAVARFFGTDPAFFGSDPSAVAGAYEQVVQRALRDCGLDEHRLCRVFSPLPEPRWDQLRRVLVGLRAPSLLGEETPQAEPEARTRLRIWSSTLTGPMNAAQLEDLCRDVLAALDVRPPWRPIDLCKRLSAYRGRRIKVKGVDLGATTSIGHLVQQSRVDSIFYERTAPAPQRDLVIAHELIHLLRRHLDFGDALTCGADLGTENAYSDWREWEAEVGARILAGLARERPRANGLRPGVSPEERGIAGAFGFVDQE